MDKILPKKREKYPTSPTESKLEQFVIKKQIKIESNKLDIEENKEENMEEGGLRSVEDDVTELIEENQNIPASQNNLQSTNNSGNRSVDIIIEQIAPNPPMLIKEMLHDNEFSQEFSFLNQLLCKLCAKLHSEVLYCPNGFHLVCRKCAKTGKEELLLCPICIPTGNRTDVQDLAPLVDPFPFIIDFINNIYIKCENYPSCAEWVKKVELREHLERNCHGELICEDCQEIFTSFQEMKEHKKICKGKSIKCGTCKGIITKQQQDKNSHNCVEYLNRKLNNFHTILLDIGIQLSFPIKRLIDYNFQCIYKSPGNTQTNFNELMATFDNTKYPRDCMICVGVQYKTNSYLELCAFGTIENVLSETRGNETNESKGVFWYMARGRAFGFSPNEKINLNKGDTEDPNCEYRMSWHLDTKGIHRSGIRMPQERKKMYFKVIYVNPYRIYDSPASSHSSQE